MGVKGQKKRQYGWLGNQGIQRGTKTGRCAVPAQKLKSKSTAEAKEGSGKEEGQAGNQGKEGREASIAMKISHLLMFDRVLPGNRC